MVKSCLRGLGWWDILIMSKSKITQKNRLTIPRLELNGEILSKIVEDFLVTQLGMSFANVYRLVDSSTDLCFVHKQDTKLKPFKGVHVSEIQTVGTLPMEGYATELRWSERTIPQTRPASQDQIMIRWLDVPGRKAQFLTWEV